MEIDLTKKIHENPSVINDPVHRFRMAKCSGDISYTKQEAINKTTQSKNI